MVNGNYQEIVSHTNSWKKIKEKQRLEIIPKSKAFLLDNLSKAKKPQNNPLVVKEKEQAELIAEIQVWKPPN